MEKKLNAKLTQWTAQFKKDIATHIIDSLGCSHEDELTDVVQYIYNYPNLNFTKEDLQKRTRVKNTVPFHDRCRALRANEDQCTRRKRAGSKFCGTHIKGTPHGEITDKPDNVESFKKVQVWAEEISGIIRHLDKNGNIYDPQDIYQGSKNPKVIAKYTTSNGVYQIQ
jgi:hypothetical protein